MVVLPTWSCSASLLSCKWHTRALHLAVCLLTDRREKDHRHMVKSQQSKQTDRTAAGHDSRLLYPVMKLCAATCPAVPVVWKHHGPLLILSWQLLVSHRPTLVLSPPLLIILSSRCATPPPQSCLPLVCPRLPIIQYQVANHFFPLSMLVSAPAAPFVRCACSATQLWCTRPTGHAPHLAAGRIAHRQL